MQNKGSTPRRKTTPSVRFWAKVNKDGPIPAHRPELGPCWVWTASMFPNGYGQFRFIGEKYAHRIAWVFTYGPIPIDQWVLHNCDRRSCTNPAHLFLGTPTDNVRDMQEKGRVQSVVRDTVTGQWKPSAVLTEADVRAIRASAATNWSLATEYGISAGYVGRLKRRECWAHLS